jgi:hypothetical protein
MRSGDVEHQFSASESRHSDKKFVILSDCYYILQFNTFLQVHYHSKLGHCSTLT